MTLDEIKRKLKGEQYDFLRQNEHLGKSLCLVTLGGSHAYGTETPDSDLDIRGCSMNGREELLLGEDFEQVVDVPTDTTIYSVNKLFGLLLSCNPNTIELLGNRPEHYLYVTKVGRLLLDNTSVFLSKRAVHSFGGYANQQLRRLENKAIRDMAQEQTEKHILRTIDHVMEQLKEHYADFPEDALRLYIDTALNDGLEKEMFMDVQLNHYPLRDYVGLWSDMQAIIRSYNKLGKRNENAMSHGKLSKHMMHLVRLYFMCLDILESERIVTYRDKEHKLLMSIRNGDYLSDGVPTPEFYEIVDQLEKRFEYAAENTSLPAVPDAKKARELKIAVNEVAIKEG